MKTTLTLFALCFSCVAFAQSFSIYKTDANAVNTATITNGSFINESTTANSLTLTKIKIKNNAAVTQSFNVTRSVVSQSPMLDLTIVAVAPTSYFCFGNNCFTPVVDTPGSGDYTVLLASGQTNATFPLADNTHDNNQPFSAYMEEGATTGNYVIKYKVFNVSNANDTLAFFIAYNQPSAIKSNDQDHNLALNIFPNPAKDEAAIFIDALNNSDIKLTVTNSIGDLVYNKEHKINAGTNNVKFECKNLAAGIYIITIQSDKKLQTKKLIITK